jgi:SpoVK/Ycf46/Vps4 family AAA+-type ATPase
LLRKGRVDEIFFVDLPTQEEREETVEIHLQKKNCEPDDFDIKNLPKEAKAFPAWNWKRLLKRRFFRLLTRDTFSVMMIY